MTRLGPNLSRKNRCAHRRRYQPGSTGKKFGRGDSERMFHRIAVGILVLPPPPRSRRDLNLLIDALLAQINREATSSRVSKHKKLSVGAVASSSSRPAGQWRELHALLRASIWAPRGIAAEDIAEVLCPQTPPAQTTPFLGP